MLEDLVKRFLQRSEQSKKGIDAAFHAEPPKRLLSCGEADGIFQGLTVQQFYYRVCEDR